MVWTLNAKQIFFTHCEVEEDAISNQPKNQTRAG